MHYSKLIETEREANNSFLSPNRLDSRKKGKRPRYRGINARGAVLSGGTLKVVKTSRINGFPIMP